MSRNIAETTRTLLMITVMVASALMPMAPGAADELRESPAKMHAAVSVDVTSLSIDEGYWDHYEIVLDEAPDGVVIITPSSDNALVTLEPAYLKFDKVNYDEPQFVKVFTEWDLDGADTTATISHTVGGTDTVFASASVADVSVTGVDQHTDTDGDGDHDGIDDDDDGDGVADSDEVDGCDLLADCDGDGTNDDTDEFPTDSSEDTDSDGDGTGDNADWDDADDTEDTDTDGDGVGDNADEYPDDANETTDTDGDGVGDNGDDFPSDATEDTDTDGDGVGDNTDWNASDASAWNDNDGDGTGDNADLDDDDDTVNDTDEESNSTLDCSVSTDCDGDGYGDADDAFDLDPEAWDDTDGDGLADSFPNLLVVTDIGCQVSVASTDTDSDGDTEEDAECEFTLPAGGSMTLYVQTGTWSSEVGVKLTHPDGTQTVWAHGTWGAYNNGFFDLGTFTDAGDYVVQMYDSYGDGCNPSTYGCYVHADAGTTMAMPSTSGYGTSVDYDDDGDGFDDEDEDTCGKVTPA